MATACFAFQPATTPAPALLAGGDSRKPPAVARAASGSSGRRFCRIYREASQWIVQLQPGVWPSNSAVDETRLRFHSLSEAVRYAIINGLSYRVLHEPPRGYPVRAANEHPARRQAAGQDRSAAERGSPS